MNISSFQPSKLQKCLRCCSVIQKRQGRQGGQETTHLNTHRSTQLHTCTGLSLLLVCKSKINSNALEKVSLLLFRQRCASQALTRLGRGCFIVVWRRIQNFLLLRNFGSECIFIRSLRMKYDSYLHLLTCWEQRKKKKKKEMSKLLLKELKQKVGSISHKTFQVQAKNICVTKKP